MQGIAKQSKNSNTGELVVKAVFSSLIKVRNFFFRLSKYGWKFFLKPFLLFNTLFSCCWCNSK
ncbi:hypothetical protein Pint_11043 [Pistacia integerrima]|uniref:Uncharacterized protein n=1 Tax=Pistacia integerrima TaxID=434235 RepID=A0ACC0XL63_9ROSI|nr:hypothetical protein Pint_11043 [Pistacia integerrima]